MLFLCCPIAIYAWAVVFLCCRPKFDKAAALAAHAVFKAVAAFAFFKSELICVGRGFYVLRHNAYQFADLFIKPLWVCFEQKAAFADRFSLDQHSSIAITEQAGSLTVSLSPLSFTPSKSVGATASGFSKSLRALYAPVRILALTVL